MNQNSIKQRLINGKAFLKAHNIESYAIDAQLLLMEATGYTKSQLILNGTDLLTELQQKTFQQYLNKRATQMPLQYILNRCEFMSLDFYVDENVLIPRPDTEILSEYAIDCVNKMSYVNLLDIGTGSGCIAVSLARYCPGTHITAVDISEKALAVAAKNAEHNGVISQITFIQSDLFQNIKPSSSGFDLIVSNPPYIPNAGVAALLDNVKQFEPHLALSGGDDGLFFYEKITKECKRFMKNTGMLLFEIGYDQGQNVKRLLQENAFHDVHILKDLAEHDRVVVGCLTNERD